MLGRAISLEGYRNIKFRDEGFVLHGRLDGMKEYQHDLNALK